MVITKKLGNMPGYEAGNKTIDWLWLEWYETGRRILHKKTEGGKEVVIKFLNETAHLAPGDVLFEDASTLIAIDITACEAIVIRPDSMYRMASLCYEIGNKHLPLFYEQDEVLVPYEAPLFRLLQAAGFAPVKELRKLVQPLKTTVTPHGETTTGGTSLFSKILKLTTSPRDE
jgi:urease accessory protein